MDSTAHESPLAVDRATIEAARRRIDGHVRRTPLWRLSGAALGLTVAEVWLKLEQLQLGGSFKARGMFNRMLANEIPAAGGHRKFNPPCSPTTRPRPARTGRLWQ